MTITRYFPGFVETTDEPDIIAEFNSLSELKEIPWIQPWFSSRGFQHFSISDKTHLMAEFKTPRSWHVVGIFNGIYDLDLPKFDSSK